MVISLKWEIRAGAKLGSFALVLYIRFCKMQKNLHICKKSSNFAAESGFCYETALFTLSDRGDGASVE